MLSAESTAGTAGVHYYDCYNGVELTPDTTTGALSFEIEPRGFGCILATPNTSDMRTTTAPTPTPTVKPASKDSLGMAAGERLRSGLPVQPSNLPSLLQTMKALTARNLSTFSLDWQYLPQTLLHANETAPPHAPRPLHNATATEVYVPGSMFQFTASSVEIEGGAGSGVGTSRALTMSSSQREYGAVREIQDGVRSLALVTDAIVFKCEDIVIARG